ncbi:hypothetical protein GPECTOR_1g58 [Gonium pectorale]|uniref:Uncharacterized protein n=1 Tax=Gonium pectorale TaxID=33097 RepID=A0A150H3M9_GONPE|nr:hypothetical protein GPECTOR_1g58 [Gonium pectorale]|eukprot:KXZ56643.1 hypothetical protein GPECTOR_1g58 [Gonium pectorale]
MQARWSSECRSAYCSPAEASAGTRSSVAGAAAASGSAPPPPSQPDGGLTPQQLLACHLLHKVSKDAGSFWAPYLRQLPRSYTSLPNFAPADAAALQLRSAVEAAEAAPEGAREPGGVAARAAGAAEAG